MPAGLGTFICTTFSPIMSTPARYVRRTPSPLYLLRGFIIIFALTARGISLNPEDSWIPGFEEQFQGN